MSINILSGTHKVGSSQVTYLFCDTWSEDSSPNHVVGAPRGTVAMVT